MKLIQTLVIRRVDDAGNTASCVWAFFTDKGEDSNDDIFRDLSHYAGFVKKIFTCFIILVCAKQKLFESQNCAYSPIMMIMI